MAAINQVKGGLCFICGFAANYCLCGFDGLQCDCSYCGRYKSQGHVKR